MKLRALYVLLYAKNYIRALSLPIKLSILCCILTISTIAFYSYSYIPYKERHQQLTVEIHALLKVQDALQAKLAMLELEKKDSEDLKQTIHHLLDDCQADKDCFNNFLQYAEGSNLHVATFNKHQTKNKDIFHKKTIQLDLEGSFFDLITFLTITHQDASLNKIKELSIKRKNEGKLDIHVVYNFYQKGLDDEAQ